MEAENKEIQDMPESLIEPLNPEEEARLKIVIDQIKEGGSGATSKKELEWMVVEKFGERAIPYIINESDGPSWAFGTKFASVKFLDTLVSKKTAPLVLKAIEDGKIDIYDGAFAAAEGKETTAEGLTNLLFKVEWPNDSARGCHTRLLYAVSLTGRDELAPKIVEFYNKLRSDVNYAKEAEQHKQDYDIDFYSNDAIEIVRALARLNGPASNKALQELAGNGDEYIKSAAVKALRGDLYIGYPKKWTIEKPGPKIPHYSLKWDKDIEPESRFLLENESRQPPAHKEILANYLAGQKNVFETLGGLMKMPEARSLADLPEEKRAKMLRVAIDFELYKCSGLLLDYSALKKSLEELKENIKAWRKEASLPDLSEENSNTVENFKHYAEYFSPETFNLPETAQGFNLWHLGLDKERQIKSFPELLWKKMGPLLTENMFNRITRGKFIKPYDLLYEVRRSFNYYREVDAEDNPIYEKAADRLEWIAADKEKVFYGRDADYFYYAMKAERFGMAGNKKLKRVFINSSMKSVLNKSDEHDPQRERILAYLLQEKITEDAVHIDTGYHGSVPEAVIKSLNPDLSDKEISKRIKLLHSRRRDREAISTREEAVYTIEGRPHSYGELKGITRDEKTGRLKVDTYEQDRWEDINAWVVSQAVIRRFAPRRPENWESSLGRDKEIEEFIEKNMRRSRESERKEVFGATKELYDKTKEIIAPVISAFADNILKKAAQRNEGEKIVFVARDGTGPYNAAAGLLEKFPEEYPGVKKDQLVYAYLTRKVVSNSSGEELAKYMGSLGVRDGDKIILADVGMFGTILSPLREKLKGLSFNRAEYLISKTSEANGFIDNDADKRLPVFENIIGNPAVHFLEDTFSGPIQSPKAMINKRGEWLPDTKDAGYPPAVAIKRKFALLAIDDYVDELSKPQVNIEQASKKLDEFLSNKKNFAKLMVPHEK